VRVLFACDLHARPDDTGREKIFLDFLRTEGNDCDALYLLGDIFEFGFVFQGKALPEYSPLIEGIADLVRGGIPVFFLGGNHDLWMTGYLYQRGIGILHDGDVINLFGKKTQIFHGILRQADALSRFADRIMKKPDAVWAYSLLPPRLGFTLALKAARISRERHQPFCTRINASSLKPIAPTAEIVITGHHHTPLSFTYEHKTFWCPGDWIRHFTYLEMTSSCLKLKSFCVNTFLGG